MAKNKKKVKNGNTTSIDMKSEEDFDFESLTTGSENQENIQLSSPVRVQIAFNTIMRFVNDFEKATKNGDHLIITAKDIAGVQQLCVGLLIQNQRLAVDEATNHYHPQRSALQKLARSKREGKEAELDKDEVECLSEIFNQFPRNIVVDFKKGVSGQREPYLRLMTRPEKKAARLRPQDPVISSAADCRLMLKVAALENPSIAKTVKSFGNLSAGLDLVSMVLRLSPSVGMETSIATEKTTSCTVNLPLDIHDQISPVVYKKNSPLQQEIIDEEAKMTDLDWRQQAQAHEATTSHIMKNMRIFFSSIGDIIPLMSGSQELGDLTDSILRGVKCLSRENLKLKRDQKELMLTTMTMKEDAMAIQTFVKKVLQQLSISRGSLRNESNLIEKLSVIGEAITTLQNARDDARNDNTPLRNEINIKDKQLLAASHDLQHSQAMRSQERDTYLQDLSRKDMEYAQSRSEYKDKIIAMERSCEYHKSVSATLSIDLARITKELGRNEDELIVITSDYESLQVDLEESRKKITHLNNRSETASVKLEELGQELELSRIALLASRTNRDVEQDRIAKAIIKATREKDELIDKLQSQVAKLENENFSSEKRVKKGEMIIDELLQEQDRLNFLKTVNKALEEKLETLTVLKDNIDGEQDGITRTELR